MSVLGLGSCTVSFVLPSKQLIFFKGVSTSESFRHLSYQVLKMGREPRVVTENSADTVHLERNSKLRQVKQALNRAMPLFVFLCLTSGYLFPGCTFVKGNVFHFSDVFSVAFVLIGQNTELVESHMISLEEHAIFLGCSKRKPLCLPYIHL